MFLLVPAYPGCPGSKAVKRSLLLLLLLTVRKNVLARLICVQMIANAVGVGDVCPFIYSEVNFVQRGGISTQAISADMLSADTSKNTCFSATMATYP